MSFNPSNLLNITTDLIINTSRFEDSASIETRVKDAPEESRDALRGALSLLYLSEGPTNISGERLKVAEQHLDPAERVVARWLYTRTNGRLKKHYGPNALHAARAAQYRCESCKFADVRTLNLALVGGRKSSTGEFKCLCANCHAINSRVNDWDLPAAE
ncbi:hypothetical protein [Adhaeretor mobilis]|nr:hypothetical protein [Adhaeretor mobilis]